jgi:hypothetical protein
MSSTRRPAACSRKRYAATCSSADVLAKRNANGFRTKLANLSIEVDCIVALVQVSRVVHGVDDAGNEERVVIWIERKPGALWAVGRSVNAHLRNDKAPRPDDYIFEGYELGDALEQANAALEDDLTVSESDGRPEHLRPFTRDELLKPLEAWFFGREQ